MTIKLRLTILVVALIVLGSAVGMLGLYGMGKSNDGLKTVYEDRTVALDQISQIDRYFVRSRLMLALSIVASTPEQIKQSAESIDKDRADLKKLWGEYMSTYLTPEEKRLAEAFARSWEAYDTGALQPALAALREGKADELKQLLLDKAEPLSRPVRADINKLRELQVTVAKEEYDAATARFDSLRIIIILSLVTVAAGSAFAGYLIIRKLYSALGGEPDYAASIVERIADGDLTVAVHTAEHDRRSLLYSMKKMRESLAKSMRQIRQASDTIASASTQIASGNMDLSSRTEQQASSLEETASSMEELTSTVKQNSDHAREANAMALSASDVAGKGGAVVAEVVKTMESINESARKIVDIISVIDGIAFQTNILALNAAVEAARAGEQGRGFAVVASEVRSLAQRSAQAAKEIKGLISDSVEKVESGSKLVNQAGSTMNEIVASVKNVTGIISQITAASDEQTAGIEQINTAIVQMDDVTQHNASLVEEAAAAAKALQDQAADLAELVAGFRLDDESGSVMEKDMPARAMAAGHPGLRLASMK
jgi:methyl-accepting chemotaxis protein-1 (serine sensor receptor)